MNSQWALQEMESIDLGDARLDMRASVILSTLGSRPNLSIPAACSGRAEMTAAYRFFNNQKVGFDQVLESHLGCTLDRMGQQKLVVVAGDTTEIELTRPHQQMDGVGHLDGVRKGVLLHELQAFTVEGTPLGTVWATCINRTEAPKGGTAAQKRQRRRKTPIESKESVRWLDGLRAVRDAAAQLPQTQCIYLADSECDIYECVAEPRGIDDGPPVLDWVIRAGYDRALESCPDALGGNEFNGVRSRVLASPLLYKAQVQVRSREAKTTLEKSARGRTRRGRTAAVEVRAATVTLRPPNRFDRELPPVTVNVVLVHEPNPPKGEPPIEWLLITTLPIDTAELVRRVVELYCLRWNIEILFRTLKSGCRVEDRLFEDVERFLPALAIYLIIAWRTMMTCRLGRECPDADCELLFEPSEWKSVWTAVKRKKPPKKKPKLSVIVHLVAQLGGYIKRPSSEPGTQTIWAGMQRMYDLAWAWDAFGPSTDLRRDV